MATSCRALTRISLASFNRTKPRPNRRLFTPPPQFSHLGLGFAPASSLHAAAAAASEPAAAQADDTVEELLTNGDKIERLMKMVRRSEPDKGRWFPYLDVYMAESMELGSGEVIDALGPYIMEARKERILKAVENRSYSVCLVVEGLTDFGNVSAAFRSADALGIQSVHVILNGGKKRCCYF